MRVKIDNKLYYFDKKSEFKIGNKSVYGYVYPLYLKKCIDKKVRPSVIPKEPLKRGQDLVNLIGHTTKHSIFSLVFKNDKDKLTQFVNAYIRHVTPLSLSIKSINFIVKNNIKISFDNFWKMFDYISNSMRSKLLFNMLSLEQKIVYSLIDMLVYNSGEFLSLQQISQLVDKLKLDSIPPEFLSLFYCLRSEKINAIIRDKYADRIALEITNFKYRKDVTANIIKWLYNIKPSSVSEIPYSYIVNNKARVELTNAQFKSLFYELVSSDFSAQGLRSSIAPYLQGHQRQFANFLIEKPDKRFIHYNWLNARNVKLPIDFWFKYALDNINDREVFTIVREVLKENNENNELWFNYIKDYISTLSISSKLTYIYLIYNALLKQEQMQFINVLSINVTLCVELIRVLEDRFLPHDFKMKSLILNLFLKDDLFPLFLEELKINSMFITKFSQNFSNYLKYSNKDSESRIATLRRKILNAKDNLIQIRFFYNFFDVSNTTFSNQSSYLTKVDPLSYQQFIEEFDSLMEVKAHFRALFIHHSESMYEHLYQLAIDGNYNYVNTLTKENLIDWDEFSLLVSNKKMTKAEKKNFLNFIRQCKSDSLFYNDSEILGCLNILKQKVITSETFIGLEDIINDKEKLPFNFSAMSLLRQLELAPKNQISKQYCIYKRQSNPHIYKNLTDEVIFTKDLSRLFSNSDTYVILLCKAKIDSDFVDTLKQLFVSKTLPIDAHNKCGELIEQSNNVTQTEKMMARLLLKEKKQQTRLQSSIESLKKILNDYSPRMFKSKPIRNGGKGQVTLEKPVVYESISG
jgi:hypothetical protein